MTKILKQYTIVPDFLYVERSADRQLRVIIDDMQRPGYVLVSRQMGKTNLLLNAKKKYETSNDIFVYIDLSNQLNNEKECFENIVNTAIDTHEEIFSEIRENIIKLRANNNKSYQLAHLDELRVLLNHISGKLIIILDEIDALTKTQYSDNIFAQIRSVYFNRLNYPILNRLTYILSGVVEPTDIIKNPKISPFNIGQKIYLDDFSKDEFIAFLTKSQLLNKLSGDVIERIYYWTNGNPRITWDLCYALEEIEVDVININNVDAIVDKIYLTSFDRPPIDNIREIVKNDGDLRDGIVQLHYNKGLELSDKIKSKLYLAGIINYEDKNVIIKNEIIKNSLSIDWLNKIEEEEKGLLKIALELQDKYDFKGSLEAFERYLQNNQFDSPGKNIYYYYMGYAAYRISNFEKAHNYLSLSIFDKNKDNNWYYTLLNLKGLNYLYLKRDLNECSRIFKEVIDAKKYDEIYYRSILNYIFVLKRLNFEKFKDEIISNYQEIINMQQSEDSNFDIHLINEFKMTSYFNLAEILNQVKENEGAIKNYNFALYLADSIIKPTILLRKYTISSKEQKKEIFIEILNFLNTVSILPEFIDPEKSMDFNADRLIEFSYYIFSDFNDDFPLLIPHLKSISDSYGEILLNLVYFGFNKKDEIDRVLFIINDLYKNIDNKAYNFTPNLVQTVYQLNALLTKDINLSVKYINVFKDNRTLEISNLDFEIFSQAIGFYIKKQDYNSALQFISIIESVKKDVPKKELINYLLINHYKSVAYYNKNRYLAVNISKEIINTINNTSSEDLSKSNLIQNNLKGLKEIANKIISTQATVQIPIMPSRKYSRNEIVEVIYKGESQKKKIKFKYIENDYKSGKCIIV
jgi:hypothetical protein